MMGWSGSSGGLPSKRPSFPWVPSTAMHSQDRKEVLSKEFWHLSLCLLLSETKVLLCLCNMEVLPSPWDSLDTTLPHHSHLAACIRLSVQTDPSHANSTSSSPVYASEPCLVHSNSNMCCCCTCHPLASLSSEQMWLQLPLNCLPAKSHCIWRNQGSISLHTEGDNITSIMLRTAKGSFASMPWEWEGAMLAVRRLHSSGELEDAIVPGLSWAMPAHSSSTHCPPWCAAPHAA